MFKQRSYQSELLDQDHIPFAHIRQNMYELDLINRLLGGHAITLKGFRVLAGTDKTITVCEIGCGGGDNLATIYNYCLKKGIEINIIGIDIKKECIDYAKSRKGFASTATWITSDYTLVKFTVKPDIIFSSLFCHHFSNEQLIFQFQWMKANSTRGFFVNDLHRHPFAYYAIKALTILFSRSYLVKNDAPVSVTRGFTNSELLMFASTAGTMPIKIQWKWAFRYLIIFTCQ